ncbi:hypothetical protein Droror1_Dr00027828 [Drosera rotundifolia]
MAPLPRKLILALLIILAAAVIALASYSTDHDHPNANRLQLGRRRLKEKEENDDGDTDFLMEMPKTKQPKKLVASSVSVVAKNKTKLVKPSSTDSLKNQTKLIKSAGGVGFAKNKTKLLKPITGLSTKNKTKSVQYVPGEDDLAASKGEKTIGLTKIKIKKLNSTSSKASNSTKSNSALLWKKSADLIKTPGGINAKNKTIKSTKTTTSQKTNADSQSKPEKITKAAIKTTSTTTKNKQQPQSPQKKPIQTSAIAAKNNDKDDDFISDLADLPVKFQQSIVPDLHLISARANKHITTTFMPYMTPSHASTLSTTLLSLTLLLLPLLLVLLLARCFKLASSSSLLKLLAFLHTYLAIYFSVLSLSSLATGLEPLRFFYSTSKSTYLCVQVMQTLGYLMYLLVNMVYLVFVFGTENGLGSRFLGLGQTFVGFAVGVHYYVTVFHRVVMRQPPRTNWKVHGVYAVSFLAVCLFAAADRRKKTYLEDGGEEGKKN